MATGGRSGNGRRPLLAIATAPAAAADAEKMSLTWGLGA